MDGAHDDEVVMRIPVVLGPAREHPALCLLQSPLRPRWRPYELECFSHARVRPQQHQMELQQPINGDSERLEAETSLNVKQHTLTTTTTVHKPSYAVGLLNVTRDLSMVGDSPEETDERLAVLHLTQLNACMQLRPTFEKMGEEDSELKEAPAAAEATVAGSASGAAAAEDEVVSRIAPILKRAETEREREARRSSHAYLMEQREAEPWRSAMLISEDKASTIELRNDLFGVGVSSMT
mmetsp:Transcript_46713/g.77308  ORF Transcript_46713/g.77308 Transcript_46713/m.77308 type:complete len:238 (-) Transcript_46713:152-865(-)